MVPLNNLGNDLNGKTENEAHHGGFDQKGYLDSDYARCNMDRKCTSKYLSVARRQICVLKYKKVAICLFAESADIFTSPLDEPTFKRLIVELGMLNIDSKPEPSVLTEEN
ncbi:hypothetical protein Tco_0066675 [Tanacetum coccineum]